MKQHQNLLGGASKSADIYVATVEQERTYTQNRTFRPSLDLNICHLFNSKPLVLECTKAMQTHSVKFPVASGFFHHIARKEANGDNGIEDPVKFHHHLTYKRFSKTMSFENW